MVTRVMVVFSVLLSALSVAVASAKEPPRMADGVGDPTVVILPSVRMDSFPLVKGTEVEVVVVGEELALRHVYPYGAGYASRTYVLRGVELHMFYTEVGLGRGIRSVLPGDRATVGDWFDFQARSASYGPDGLVDDLYLSEVRAWTPAEEQVVSMALQFAEDAKMLGLVYLSYAADCWPEFRLDGQPLARGPYGGTILVPSEGGQLTAYMTPEHVCWDALQSHPSQELPWGGTGNVFWSVQVKAGDAVLHTPYSQEDVETLAGVADPYRFCGMLTYMRPQWQAPISLRKDVGQICSSLYELEDLRPHAFLARMGYREAWRNLSDTTPDWNVFVWGAEGASIEIPVSRWEDTFEIRLGYDPQSVYLMRNMDDYGRPMFHLLGGADEIGTDLPGVVIGEPFIFYPVVLSDTPFSWGYVEVYRVVRDANGRLVLQHGVWAR